MGEDSIWWLWGGKEEKNDSSYKHPHLYAGLAVDMQICQLDDI